MYRSTTTFLAFALSLALTVVGVAIASPASALQAPSATISYDCSVPRGLDIEVTNPNAVAITVDFGYGQGDQGSLQSGDDNQSVPANSTASFKDFLGFTSAQRVRVFYGDVTIADETVGDCSSAPPATSPPAKTPPTAALVALSVSVSYDCSVSQGLSMEITNTNSSDVAVDFGYGTWTDGTPSAGDGDTIPANSTKSFPHYSGYTSPTRLRVMSEGATLYDSIVADCGADTPWPTTLASGSALGAGERLAAPSSPYYFVMQADGNAVVHGPSGIVWSSGTSVAGSWMVMGADGNLVIDAPSTGVIWNSGTAGNSGATLVMQPDGDLVVFDSSHSAVWTSFAHGGTPPTAALVALSVSVSYDCSVSQGLSMEITNTNSSDVAVDFGYGTWTDGTPSAGDGDTIPANSTKSFPHYSGYTSPTRLRVMSEGATLYDSIVADCGADTPWPTTLASGSALGAGERLAAPSSPYYFVMQADGNAVVHGPSGIVWSSGTSVAGSWMVMGADGNLVIDDPSGDPLWNSGTAGTTSAILTMQSDGDLVVHRAGQSAVWESFAHGGTPPPPPPLVAPTVSVSYDCSVSQGLDIEVTNPNSSAVSVEIGYGTWTDGTPAAGDGPEAAANTTTSFPHFSGFTSPTRLRVMFGGATLYDSIVADCGADTPWSATLASGYALGAGEQIAAPSGGYYLVMQPDGNAVVYSSSAAIWNSGTSIAGSWIVMGADGNLVIYAPSGRAVWNSGTDGKTSAALTMQTDGNLVVYRAGHSAVWSSFAHGGTPPPPPPSPLVAGPDSLATGAQLASGETLSSESGAFRLAMQSDGNAVVYRASTAVWNSSTFVAGSRLVMQPDGNLVIYAPSGRAVWSSGTAGKTRAILTMQSDGNLVVYRAGPSAAWNTFANGGTPPPLPPPPLVAGPDSLATGAQLASGEELSSISGGYRLVMQPDGNAVVYRGSSAVWNSATFVARSRLVMQPDGNLVIYATTGRAVWSSGTAGSANAILTMQSDGNLVVYRPDRSAAWNAFAHGGRSR